MNARTILIMALLLTVGCQRPEPTVVVYCAQDREFAEPIFDDLQKELGVRIVAKYDTEANKSVSLAAELLADRERPRADLHWNNEPLHTVRLARAGVYEKYEAPQSKNFPAWTRGGDGTWQAFAARARVLIVNTNLVAKTDRPKSTFDLLKPKFAGKIGIAKPLFGTTATHAACLFDVLGRDAAKEFFRGLKSNNVTIFAGNKQVAVAVAKGEIAIGWTDTDDALIERNSGQPVELIYPDSSVDAKYPRLGVLYLPNTLALINGGPNPEAARRVYDALLDPRVEVKLAEHRGFQIPLNPLAIANVKQSIFVPDNTKRMEVNFETAADLFEESQAFLRAEFTK